MRSVEGVGEGGNLYWVVYLTKMIVTVHYRSQRNDGMAVVT
jgi:hypothetical protein